MKVDPEKVAEQIRQAAEVADRMSEVVSAFGRTIVEVADAIQKLIDSLPEDFLQQSQKGDTITLVSTDQEGGQI